MTVYVPCFLLFLRRPRGALCRTGGDRSAGGCQHKQGLRSCLEMHLLSVVCNLDSKAATSGRLCNISLAASCRCALAVPGSCASASEGSHVCVQDSTLQRKRGGITGVVDRDICNLAVLLDVLGVFNRVALCAVTASLNTLICTEPDYKRGP